MSDNRSLNEQLAHCDGKDCRCNAWAEGECACGADWTPADIYRLRSLLDQQASAKTQPAVSDAPISIEAVTAACDAYTESAVEHGWERETIEDILRNDDMRAAIAAAIAVIKEPQA